MTVKSEVVLHIQPVPGDRSSLSQWIDNIPVPIKAIVVGMIVYAIGSFPSLAAGEVRDLRL